MNTLCEVLEDRPNTFKEFETGLVAHGFKIRITRSASTFASRIGQPPDGLAGWLVDNHIDKCFNLKDFGHPEIGTNGGAEAGFKIVSEIMIPKINDGQLPKLPLGLMSAQDVRRSEAMFRNRFGDDAPNVYFVEKSRSSDEILIKIKGYVTALEKVANFDSEIPDGTVQIVRTKMLRQAASNLGLSDDELAKLLRLRPSAKATQMISGNAIQLDTANWEEMAVIIFNIDAALSNAFSDSTDSLAEARHWLSSFPVGKRGMHSREMLLTGEFEAAYTVLDAATFFLEDLSAKSR